MHVLTRDVACTYTHGTVRPRGEPTERAAIYARVSTSDKDQNPVTQLIPCGSSSRIRNGRLLASSLPSTGGMPVQRSFVARMTSEPMEPLDGSWSGILGGTNIGRVSASFQQS